MKKVDTREFTKACATMIVDEIYTLCNKHLYFTEGTNEQYEEMFDSIRQGATPTEVAFRIYICSRGEFQEDILKEVRHIYQKVKIRARMAERVA